MNKKLQELKTRQVKQRKAQSKTNKSTQKVIIPTYDLKGRNRAPEFAKRRKRISITIIVVGVIVSFLYLPGFFIKDNSASEQAVTHYVNLDRDATRTINTLLRSDGDSDYDGDGVSNSDEADFGTSPYLSDTDNDHVTDYAEKYVTKTDPTKGTSVLVDYQTKQDEEKGKNVSSPYSINNVIMYPSNYASRSYGGVVQLDRDKKGLVGAYRFVDFNGYVQFPEDGYAYKYENGTHTLLTKDEKNNVWKIEGSCVVEVYSSQLKEMKKLTVFNHNIYLDSNEILDVISKILPSKGFVTMTDIVEVDTYADTSKNTVATIEKPVYDTSDTTRFKNNTNSLNDLLFVRSTIEEGGCVAVSLFSEDDGEYIGIIYGYDAEGNLMVADPDTLEDIGKLYIKEKTVKMLDEMGDIVLVSSFDWSGLGLSSSNGFKISFFAATKNTDTKTETISSNNKTGTKSDSTDTTDVSESIEFSTSKSESKSTTTATKKDTDNKESTKSSEKAEKDSTETKTDKVAETNIKD